MGNRALLGFSAILLAGCAAFFSVTGLGNLFNSVAVIVMAATLEFSKLVTASYLKQKWHELDKALRFYLAFAVVILMLITSMGIYGYLSNSFQKQLIRLDQVERQVSLLQNKIDINKKEVNRYEKQSESTITIRNSQEQNLSKLINDNRSTGKVSSMISNADNLLSINSRKIDSLNLLNVSIYEKIDSVKNVNLDLEREIGGFRFIAESFNIPLKKAVKWFILMIVFVFDPFAIALLLAFTKKGKMKSLKKDWVQKLPEENIHDRILETIGEDNFIVELGVKEFESAICISNDDSIESKKHEIFSGNVIALLKTYRCPKEFDLLNINLKGTDYWVLREILKSYRPRCVITTINPQIERNRAVTIKDDANFKWENDSYFGYSFEAAKKLAAENDYSVIRNVNNQLYWIANEYMKGVYIPEVDYQVTEQFPSSNKFWIDV